MRNISEKVWNIGFTIFYVLSHIFALTALPIFADEAIYIHWSQVAFNEPSKYLFLSMLDGKPPLHIWLLMPFVKLFEDPLLGGRLLSVFLGLISVFVIKELVKELGGGKLEQRASMVLATITPFLFFLQRMALAESLLLLLFSLSLLFAFKVFRTGKKLYVLLFALSFGASLWTKTTALFFIPIFACIPLYYFFSDDIKLKKYELKKILKQTYLHKHTMFLILGGIVAGLLFLTLKMSPLFPSLFSRSADYAFSLKDLEMGEWKYVFFKSYPKVITWIVWYMTPFLCFVGFYGKKKNILLLLMTFVYLFPLIILGRVLSSRYFFPVSVFIIMMAVFGLKEALVKANKRFIYMIITLYFISSFIFMYSSYVSVPTLPLTMEDKHQYLMEWSSGYGIPEVREYIKDQVKQGKVVTVGTEGYFGTLPDGLSVYFDKPEYSGKVYILGVGQPVTNIPDTLIESAKKNDTYLVVNQNRFLVNDPEKYTILFAYEKPLSGAPLLLIKIH